MRWALSNSVKRLGHFCFANVCIPQIHLKTVFCVNRHQTVTRIRCNWSHFNLFCVVYCVLLCVSVQCPLSKSPEYLWAHTATFPPAPEKKTRSAKVKIETEDEAVEKLVSCEKSAFDISSSCPLCSYNHFQLVKRCPSYDFCLFLFLAYCVFNASK